MRAVCKTLAEVDRLCAAGGQPDLAVLVVRESDRLPGQGWWVGGTALLLGYDGPWEGASAARFIREQQQAVFDYWRSEEHTSELQSLMRISYAVFCLKKKKK